MDYSTLEDLEKYALAPAAERDALMAGSTAATAGQVYLQGKELHCAPLIKLEACFGSKYYLIAYVHECMPVYVVVSASQNNHTIQELGNNKDRPDVSVLVKVRQAASPVLTMYFLLVSLIVSLYAYPLVSLIVSSYFPLRIAFGSTIFPLLHHERYGLVHDSSKLYYEYSSNNSKPQTTIIWNCLPLLLSSHFHLLGSDLLYVRP
jgi:hypothetical protein